MKETQVYNFDLSESTRGNWELWVRHHYGESGVHTWEEYQIRPYYYSAPRSVQVGLSVDF